MAIVRITSTTNSGSALNYTMGTHGHNGNELRYVDVSGWNMMASDEKNMIRQMHSALDKAKRPHKIEAYRVVQSFSATELDPSDPKNIELCNQMGYELAKEMYPHSPVSIVTQIDGRSGLLHNHLTIGNIDLQTGNALRGAQTHFQELAKANDKVMQAHGFEPLPTDKNGNPKFRRDKESEIERTNRLTGSDKYSWKADLKNRIGGVLTNDKRPIVNREGFAEEMNNADVDVRYRGKGVSYSFVDKDGKQRTARGKTLGTDFTVPAIEASAQRTAPLFEAMLRSKRKAEEEEKAKQEALRHENMPSDEEIDKQMEAEGQKEFDAEVAKASEPAFNAQRAFKNQEIAKIQRQKQSKQPTKGMEFH